MSKTMRTKSVVAWFQSQGMPQASTKFSELFKDIENVDYKGIEGFLPLIYGPGDDEYMFRKMKCDITTTMNLDLEIQD
jgi:hypothetical protein